MKTISFFRDKTVFDDQVKMGCTASTMNTTQDCLNIIQIFVCGDTNKNKLDLAGLNVKSDDAEVIQVSNKLRNQSNVKTKNDPKELNDKQPSLNSNGKQKSTCCDDKERRELENILVSINLIFQPCAV